ncbi:MAG: tyrosine--tRNA ligase, partial [Patescibacteria group bacterium]|nr:tyrosine--tRNA ligase [Patescibacteria group bacterium]
MKKENLDLILKRGVASLINEESLSQKLSSGKQLRIKYGIDPTTKDLHLGYWVILRKLRKMQDLGHKVVLLIGGFTARFGDPTDKIKARTLRDKNEVSDAAKNYLEQVKGILDFDENKLEIRDNSEWYDKMSAEELLKLLSNFSHSQLIERDMFQERLKNKQEIRAHELAYPILQGYDSVEIHSDIAFGGMDQTFNELAGRSLQIKFKQAPQDLVFLKMIPGIDGTNLMSQSADNIVKLKSDSREQFAKIMSIPDSIMPVYFESLTDIAEDEYETKIKSDPRGAKIILAQSIVEEIWGEEKAAEAKIYFESVFSKRELNEAEIAEVEIKTGEYTLKDLLVELKLASSKS